MASTWDGVTDEQIWERDGWQCKIPGCELGLIVPGVAWPDPLSKSVDHIVPLSRGGTDTALNKRAAHLVCNVRRNNRMHPDDVPVITLELVPLGLIPARLRSVRVCVNCEMRPVKAKGARCASCRTAARMFRQQQALAMREQGSSWQQIADALGLSGPGAAHNVAYPPW